MKPKSWHLNRREMLKGGGIALTLPFLNGMSWAAPGKAPLMYPKRMLVSYFSYGAYMPNGGNGIPDPNKPHHDWSWWPRRDAGPLTFNQSAKPFEPLKDYVSYYRGLDHAGGWGLGGHSSGDVLPRARTWWARRRPTAFPSTKSPPTPTGIRHASPPWCLARRAARVPTDAARPFPIAVPGRPIPSMHKPQEIFNRLFNPYAGKGVEQVRAGLKREASILDLLLDQSRSLKGRLGHEDQGKVEEYLESIRALEQRVERTSKWTHEPLPEIDTKGLNLDASHKDPKEYIRCMYDLVYLAFQTDTTRFASLMLESENSSNSELWNYATYVLGYKGATHDIAHKRPVDYSGQWDRWRAEQHAYFLQRLKDTPESDGNMLDRTVVLWGSAHPHASHSTKNYPIHLAGGNRLGLKHGHLHAFEGEKKVPLANLFLSMLHAVDVPVKSFADSTGLMAEAQV